MSFTNYLWDILHITFPSDYYSDKGFERKIQRTNREYRDNKELALRNNLETAYYHSAVESAFWWLENIKIKPTSGSDDDILHLHTKFKLSLELGSLNDKRQITREKQKRFVYMAMPDIDYQSLVKMDKKDYLDLIMEGYDTLKNCQNSFIKKNASPFITGAYYLLFNADKMIDENGKRILDENGKSAYNHWVNDFLDKHC